MTAARLPLVAAALFCLTAGADERPTFRSSAEYVAVDVQVLAAGQPVPGLTREDFLVLDEGVPQRIATFARDDVELDVLLLIDVSGSTRALQLEILQSAAQALSHLYFRDRVGIAVFDMEPYVILAPTWDRSLVLKKLYELPWLSRGTELNTTLRAAAKYLQRHSRPGARRAIVALTDSVAYRTSKNREVRNDLWETDTVLNAVLFKSRFRGGEVDIRDYVRATGGEYLDYAPGSLPLVEIFQRMRQRYVLLYPAPESRPGQVHSIRVDLTKAAKSRLRDLTVRVRSGYIAGVPGSDSRLRVDEARNLP